MKIITRKFITVFLFISFFLSSCMNAKPGISQLWFYTYRDGSADKGSLTPANFLELKPDGLFSSDLGKFRAGHWTLRDQQLFLKSDDGTETILFINELKPGELNLRYGTEDAAHFDASPIPKSGKDPFSKEKNLWRIPAVSKESDEQIRTRLKNHCNFWVNYFGWALDNELTTVDVRSTPTPIKIFGNGFTIKSFKDLPENWKRYFYDSADCVKANEMLVDLVNTHTIAWAHTDNKYKMFISAFQQMEGFLR